MPSSLKFSLTVRFPGHYFAISIFAIRHPSNSHLKWKEMKCINELWFVLYMYPCPLSPGSCVEIPHLFILFYFHCTTHTPQHYCHLFLQSFLISLKTSLVFFALFASASYNSCILLILSSNLQTMWNRWFPILPSLHLYSTILSSRANLIDHLITLQARGA